MPQFIGSRAPMKKTTDLPQDLPLPGAPSPARGMRGKSTNRVVLTVAVAAVLLLASNLMVFRSDLRRLIESDCALFYSPVGLGAVQECIAEMSRRHFLPTSDESILAQPSNGAVTQRSNAGGNNVDHDSR